MAFIFEEIDNNRDYRKARPDALNEATKVKDATRIFMDEYERPGKDHVDWREEEAEKVYAAYATGR